MNRIEALTFVATVAICAAAVVLLVRTCAPQPRGLSASGEAALREDLSTALRAVDRCEERLEAERFHGTRLVLEQRS